MGTQLFRRTAIIIVLASQVGFVTAPLPGNPPIPVRQANGDDTSVYLPLVLLDSDCSNFFDDFSNPASGWFAGEDNRLLAGYQDGEYRVLVKRSYSSSIIDAPACKQTDYTVAVDARWADAQSTGISYGLMLGRMENPSQLYLFEVDTVAGEFNISHYGQGGWEYIVDSQTSTAIYDGATTNTLAVIHDGNWFTAMVNGIVLHSWEDTSGPGEKGLGLVVLSHVDSGNADARFDDFRVTKISK